MNQYQITNFLLTATLLIVSMVSINAEASKYEVILNSRATLVSEGFGYSEPFIGMYETKEVEVSFKIADSTSMNFGDFSCAGRSPPACGAYGYLVSGVRLTVGGVAQTGWISGTNAKSFLNGPIDLMGRGFFTNTGLSEISTAWLPLINPEHPNTSINFGQMYVSNGGVGFETMAFSARDQLDRRFSGLAGATSTILPEVPEPATKALWGTGILIAAFFSLRLQEKEKCTLAGKSRRFDA